MPSITELIRSGLRHHQSGRLVQAQAFYERVLAIKPSHPDALNLLGVIALKRNECVEAVSLLKRALAAQPDNPGYSMNLAQALFGLARYREAQAVFERTATLDPADPQPQVGAASCLATQGHLAQAEQRLRDVLAHHPRYAIAWFNLGNCVRDGGRPEEALEFYQRALALQPNDPEVCNSLASALHACERLPEAEAAFRRCAEIAPQFALARGNLALVLIDQGKFDDAEQCARAALHRDPELALAHYTLGSALLSQGRAAEARAALAQAVAREPQVERFSAGLVQALAALGRIEEALAVVERSLVFKPESWALRFSAAMAQLLAGSIADGMSGYRSRPVSNAFAQRHPGVALSENLPADLGNANVLMLGEQGLGDELFFLRYAPRLAARGARITYRASPKLASMLGRVPVLERVVSDREPIPEADFALRVGDAAHLLGQTESSAFQARVFAQPFRPGSVGAFVRSLPRAAKVFYPELPPPLGLTALAEQRAAVERRLAELGGPPYVGLTWRGGVAPEDQRGVMPRLFKHIPLERLAGAVRAVPGTLLVLQRKPRPGEIQQLSQCVGRPVHDLSALNEDLEALLALLALIDDYVGVSNTNMHLRAGVGRTARVLVPSPAEWRWRALGEESPWFPGFRIYRQKPDGDWDAALDRLAHDLRAAFGAQDR